MDEIDNDLSTAIVLYLRFKTASFPQNDADAVLRKFGIPDGTTLLARVRNSIEELGSIKIDWANNDLRTGGEIARAELHGRHTCLSDQALDALVWKFSFDWR